MAFKHVLLSALAAAGCASTDGTPGTSAGPGKGDRISEYSVETEIGEKIPVALEQGIITTGKKVFATIGSEKAADGRRSLTVDTAEYELSAEGGVPGSFDVSISADGAEMGFYIFYRVLTGQSDWKQLDHNGVIVFDKFAWHVPEHIYTFHAPGNCNSRDGETVECEADESHELSIYPEFELQIVPLPAQDWWDIEGDYPYELKVTPTSPDSALLPSHSAEQLRHPPARGHSTIHQMSASGEGD